MEKKKKKKKPWKLIERPYTSAHVHTPASGCSQAVFRVHTRHPYARASLHAIVGTGEKRLTSSLVRRAPPTTALVRRNPMIRGGRWFSYSRSSSEFLQSAPGTKKRKKKKGHFLPALAEDVHLSKLLWFPLPLRRSQPYAEPVTTAVRPVQTQCSVEILQPLKKLGEGF